MVRQIFILYLGSSFRNPNNQQTYRYTGCDTTVFLFSSIRRTYVNDILVPPGECNMPVLDGQTLTREKFLKEFAYNVPIVIRDATDNSIFRALCHVSNI